MAQANRTVYHLRNTISLLNVAVLFAFLLTIRITIAWDQTPNNPTPYYLTNASSLRLSPDTTIIDTARLNDRIYVMTGQNGSSVVRLHRHILGTTEWSSFSTDLSDSSWAFDTRRVWSSASFLISPSGTAYIVYLYLVKLVVQTYLLVDSRFGSSSQVTAPKDIFDLTRMIPNPHLIMEWADNSMILVGVHSIGSSDGVSASYFVGRFLPWLDGVALSGSFSRQGRITSIEFSCSTTAACSPSKVRLFLPNFSVQFLNWNGAQYSLSAQSDPVLELLSEVSVKCYNRYYNTTFILHPHVLDDGSVEPYIQKLAYENNEFEVVQNDARPLLSFQYHRNQMDLKCRDDSIYVAIVTTSSLVTGQRPWDGKLNDNVKGKADIAIFKASQSNSLTNLEFVILSTPGNDNVSRIEVDPDFTIHTVGITEGDIRNPNNAALNPVSLFVASFRHFSVSSVDIPRSTGEIEIQPGEEIMISFSSLPPRANNTFTVTMTVNWRNCTDIRWVGSQLLGRAPSGAGRDVPLMIRFLDFPYIPSVKTQVSYRKPVILEVVTLFDGLDVRAKLRFLVLNVGDTEFRELKVRVGVQDCTNMTLSGSASYSDGTIFTCLWEFGKPGLHPIGLTVSNNPANTNLKVRVTPQAHNISFNAAEGQEAMVTLNCTARNTSENEFQFRIKQIPHSGPGLLLKFESSQPFDRGNDVEVSSSSGKLRFKATNHGKAEFEYYCVHTPSGESSNVAKVNIFVRPTIQDCRNTIFISGNIALDRRDPQENKELDQS
ncbi:hypothetical protein BKA69DRAFT_353198 [Paraphysoderma sedebokerense]|nr:hypothetical protein BKA69DRAFT_353198 [Paraphysoderma sedebokerense]